MKGELCIVRSAGEYTWHIADLGGNGAPLCGAPLFRPVRRYVVEGPPADDPQCARCATLRGLPEAARARSLTLIRQSAQASGPLLSIEVEKQASEIHVSLHFVNGVTDFVAEEGSEDTGLPGSVLLES